MRVARSLLLEVLGWKILPSRSLAGQKRAYIQRIARLGGVANQISSADVASTDETNDVLIWKGALRVRKPAGS